MVYLRTVVGMACLALVLPATVPMAGAAGDEPNQLTPQERAAGWRLLFDGQTTSGWRGYKQRAAPAGWQVVDGALTRVGGGGDILTSEEFADFELAFEWNIAPGGNSGVFYRATEEAAAIWQSAPEFQILDNAGHKDGQKPETSAGSNYALNAPTRDATRRPGAWNQARIVAKGGRVEHWLNGEKIVEYEVGSPDWTKRVAASKFAPYPGYGRASSGRIALQDHGDRVAFRSIKVRTI